MKKCKLFSVLALAGLTALVGLSACSKSNGDSSSASGNISVVSREDGSGTRGAFVELFGVQEEQNGLKQALLFYIRLLKYSHLHQFVKLLKLWL